MDGECTYSGLLQALRFETALFEPRKFLVSHPTHHHDLLLLHWFAWARAPNVAAKVYPRRTLLYKSK
jgi:hypothetical protein